MHIAPISTVTTDGYRYPGASFRPLREIEGTVVFMHGLGGGFLNNPKNWVLGEACANAGWQFIAGNHRGTAALMPVDVVDPNGSTGDAVLGGSLEIITDSVIDIAAWCEHAEGPIVLCGHSLGAEKVVLAANQHLDDRLAGIILLAPTDIVALAQNYEHFTEMRADAEKLISEGQPESFLSNWHDGWMPMTARAFLQFADRSSPSSAINAAEVDPNSPLAQVDVPILAVIGSVDTCMGVSAEQGMETIRKTATNAPSCETHVIPEANHQFEPRVREMCALVTDWLARL